MGILVGSKVGFWWDEKVYGGWCGFTDVLQNQRMGGGAV